MGVMSYTLYNAALAFLKPLGRAWLASHPKYRVLQERFAPSIPPNLVPDCLWAQACSAGEVTLAREFLKAAALRFPNIPQLLTASTVTGRELADRSATETPTTWCPFDFKQGVRFFLAQIQPRGLILLETELWPNLVCETQRMQKPVFIINGRLSDKHQKRYHQARFFIRPMLERMTLACMQNKEYAERLIGLGMAPDKVHVTGNLKFDSALDTVSEERIKSVRAECGFSTGNRILIFGSTRPGDENLAMTCWRELREKNPELKLVIAPRHVQRVDEIMPLINEPFLRRSEIHSGKKPDGERVLLLDTVGELVTFYGLADLAVVGGSFYPGVNGHNPIEPAALGVATVFGPYMRNFSDAARALVVYQGALQVSIPGELPEVLITLFASETTRCQLAQNGCAAVKKNRGATRRTLELIAPYVERGILSC